MSLILQPASAPSQSGSRPTHGAAQHNDQESTGLPSFCDVFFRSLSPGAQRWEEAALTAAGLTPEQRQTEDGKNAAADTVNALAMTLVALDASSVKPTLAGPQVSASGTDSETSPLPGSGLRVAPASTTLGPTTTLAALTDKPTTPSSSPDHSALGSASTPVTGLTTTEPLQPALPKRADPASGLAALRDKTAAIPDPMTVSAPALLPVAGGADVSSASDAQTIHGRYPKVALSVPSPATLAMASYAHDAPTAPAPDSDPTAGKTRGPELRGNPASTSLGATTSLAALTVKATTPSPSPYDSASGSASVPVTGLTTEPLQPTLPKRAGPASGLAALRGKTAAIPDPVAVSAPALAPVTGSAALSSASDAQTSHGRHPKVALSAPSPATLAMASDAHGAAAAPAPDSDPAASLTRGPELRGDPASTGLAATTSLAALTVKATTPSPSPDDSASESASVLVTGLGTEPLAPAAPKRAGPASGLAALGDKTAASPDLVAVSAPAMAPAAGSAALSSASDAQTSHGRHPKVALSTSSPATLAMSSDAHGAPAAPTPDSDPAASLTRGPELRGDPASTTLAATTTLAAMTVKPTPTSAGPNNKTPLAAAAALTGLDTEPLPVPVPGRLMEADTSAPQADSPALTADAGTSAGQASAGANSMPGADSFNSNANWLTHPLAATTASSPTGVAASNTAASMTSSPLLTPEVGSKEWDKALGQQVVQLGKAGHQITELQLNPPGLGPLKVTLEMNHHQMQVMFVSAHASVRAAVEAAVPQLRASLADSGISLGNTSVSSESQAQTAFAQHQNPAPRHQAYRNNSQPETTTPGARALAGTRQPGAGLGVDTYA